MPTRVVLGTLGLVAAAPYLAWSGGASATDALMAAAMAAPLLAALVTVQSGRRAASHAATGAGTAALAALSISAFGTSAWPVLGLLAVEPLCELLSGRARSALAAMLGASAGFLLALLSRTAGPAVTMVAGDAALGVLVLQVLVLTGMSAWMRLRPVEVTVTDASPAFDGVPLSAIGELVTWHDAFGDVLRAGGAPSAILGASPLSLSGGGYLTYVHVSDRPVFLKALSDAANGSEPVRVTFRVRAESPGEATGAARTFPGVTWVEMRALRLALPDASGAVVIAFTQDVSAQLRHAEELESAKAEAERANELKGTFLATVSHELRTPLNAIIGFSELLAADHPFLITDERRREYADIIRSSGHHLLELVNTLLDMSKIETGNFNVEPEPFRFIELATSCCDLIQLKADQAGVRLERRLAQDLPEIVGDRRACRQILLNLVSNAVKFTPAAGHVTVSLAANGEDLVLVVADTGIGIPEADLPRLGDPFFQSGEVHRRNHEGTGLGLSVVRGLVGLHGGRMAIESGAGAGTTVTVSLPFAGHSDSKPAKPAIVQTFPRVAVQAPDRKTA